MIKKILLIAGVFAILFFIAREEPQNSGLHYSVYSQPEFFDKAYENPREEKPSEKVAGVIVNHHLLAPRLIARAINQLATLEPITIVLVSPNHFSAGVGQV